MFLVFLSMLVLSCGKKTHSAEESATAVVDQIDTEMPEAAKEQAQPEKKVEAVKEPRKLLEDSVLTDFGWLKQELISKHRLDDNGSYVIFSRSNGVCEFFSIATVLGDSIYEELEIGDNCDREQSSASHSYVEQVKDDSTGLFWLEVESHVKDTFLTADGYLPDSLSLEDVEEVNDTSVIQLYIQKKDYSIGKMYLHGDG